MFLPLTSLSKHKEMFPSNVGYYRLYEVLSYGNRWLIDVIFCIKYKPNLIVTFKHKSILMIEIINVTKGR